jgi:hypothetical protein
MLGTPSNVFLSRLLRAKYSEGDEGIIMTLLVGEKRTTSGIIRSQMRFKMKALMRIKMHFGAKVFMI